MLWERATFVIGLNPSVQASIYLHRKRPFETDDNDNAPQPKYANVRTAAWHLNEFSYRSIAVRIFAARGAHNPWHCQRYVLVRASKSTRISRYPPLE